MAKIRKFKFDFMEGDEVELDLTPYETVVHIERMGVNYIAVIVRYDDFE